eukprot:6156909-Pyramimonas_sp.AAC.1
MEQSHFIPSTPSMLTSETLHNSRVNIHVVVGVLLFAADACEFEAQDYARHLQLHASYCG